MGSCFSPYVHTPLPKLKHTSLGLAKWMCRHDTFNFWIDLRPTDIPVGQLLRELKTLRGYAPRDAVIAVVLAQAPESTLEMLRHEGFQALTRDMLLNLGL